MLPLVSVIIPTYKRSEMLPRAIESVLGQTYLNVQVVVVDDNDPDSEYRNLTEKRMELYSSCSKVKYVKHNQNRNGSVARNTGIANSDGELITFLDDDDVYLADKVRCQVDFLLNNVEYRAVYCGWDRCGVFEPQNYGNLSYDLLSGDHIIYTNAIMMWKKDALACGGWDETFLRHQEAAFLLRFFRFGGKIGVIKESLVVFDISDRRNVASNPKKNEEQVLHLLETFSDIIDECESFQKGAKKNIFSHRNRGVFLCYLKRRSYLQGIFFYIRCIMEMPIKFNIDLVSYLLKNE